MELFARESQHEPLKMLADLVKLYALTYDYSGAEAVKAIKRDAQALSDVANGKARIMSTARFSMQALNAICERINAWMDTAQDSLDTEEGRDYPREDRIDALQERIDALDVALEALRGIES